MADVIRLVVHDALEVDNAVLHQRVVDFNRRQKGEGESAD
jgi:hypothetical protein